MSKLNHLLTALPNPKDLHIDTINDMFYKFLWSDKPDKINRITIELDHVKGGIKMINLRNSITALKATWMRRLLANKSHNKPLWIELFEKMYCTSTRNISNFGCHYSDILKKRSKNLFWRHVFEAWVHISNKQEFKNHVDILTSPLWYNTTMSYKEMYLPKWYDRGIVSICDVIDIAGNVMDLDKIKSTYNIESINPLHYL